MPDTPDMRIGTGDVYCPRCLGEWIEYSISADREAFSCDSCGPIQTPHLIDADGRFWWGWNERNPAPNPGCPWCGTCNIGWSGAAEPSFWWCKRSACRAAWRGHWTLYPSGRMRWTLRVPTRDVPWREIP